VSGKSNDRVGDLVSGRGLPGFITHRNRFHFQKETEWRRVEPVSAWSHATKKRGGFEKDPLIHPRDQREGAESEHMTRRGASGA